MATMTTEQTKELAAPLQIGLARIIELTFQDAVNGHLNDSQTITRDEIGQVYEIARKLAALRELGEAE